MYANEGRFEINEDEFGAAFEFLSPFFDLSDGEFGPCTHFSSWSRLGLSWHETRKPVRVSS